MPSTATITAFYSFTQNTKARASQVTNNFSVFRGHFISIDPNTVTSTDITYDLGSDEHRWRTSYVKTVDFDRSTSTASATIEADANTNTGEMIFKMNGTEKARINTYGLTRASTPIDYTFSSGVVSTDFMTTTLSEISGLSLTITGGGRPIRVGLTYLANTAGGVFLPGYLRAEGGASSGNKTANFQIFRNTTTSIVAAISISMESTTTWQVQTINPEAVQAIDWSASSGQVRYFCMGSYLFGSTHAANHFNIANVRLFAYEL